MTQARKTSGKAGPASSPEGPSPAAKAGIVPWPPVIYLAGIAAGVALDAAYALPWFGSPMSDILVAVGWLVLFAFVVLFVSAIHTLRRARTPVNPNSHPEHLVTGGPFGISRNPIYVADTLLLIGLCLVSGIAWFLPIALLCAFITQKVAIEREERWLAEKFGRHYREYAKRVRRWL